MSELLGPSILTRTMSVATRRGKSPNAWQYHSRSDTHSKIACWAVLFDLLRRCDVLQAHAREGRIGFGINYVMVGPINKTLDLVVTRVPTGRIRSRRVGLEQLARGFGISLTDAELAFVNQFPAVVADTKADVFEVAIALEAKACMTEHVKSIPRLFAEILATGYLARKASPNCITVSYSIVNGAATFISPGRTGKQTLHDQPAVAKRVVDMLGTALPTSKESRDVGYDALGVTVIDCPNDGSPVRVSDGAAAPTTSDHFHYERMILAICSEYRRRFRD